MDFLRKIESSQWNTDPYFCSYRIRLSVLFFLWLFFVTPVVLTQIIGGYVITNVYFLFFEVLLQLPLVAIIILTANPNKRLHDETLKKYMHQHLSSDAIKIPNEWPNIDCPRTEIRRRIPVLGLLFGLLYDSKWDILGDLIWQQLEARKEPISTYWKGYEIYLPIVLDLQRTLEEHCWGIAPAFTPEDDYDAIGQIMTGDLCEVAAIMELEEKYKVTILKDRMFHPAFEGSMLDAVKFLYEAKEASRPGRLASPTLDTALPPP